MLDRYADTNITGIWSTPSHMDAYTEIEAAWITAVAAVRKLDVMPYETIAAIRVHPDGVANVESRTHHDIQAFLLVLERHLNYNTASVLHLGLTSSDVVDTANAMLVYDSVEILLDALSFLPEFVAAVFHSDTYVPVYTHGQYAGKLPARYFGKGLVAELEHALEHAARATIPFGIGGPIGYWPDDMSDLYEARYLFSKHIHDRRHGIPETTVYSQIVNRRHYHELANELLLVSTALARVALALRFLHLRGLLNIGQASPSSSLPHKSNPAALEKICGLTRVARGYAQMATENTELWEQRDISNSAVERIWIPELFHVLLHQADTMRRVLLHSTLDDVAATRVVSQHREQDAQVNELYKLQMSGVPYSIAWNKAKEG